MITSIPKETEKETEKTLDISLVQACQRGDIQAFSTLFERYRDLVFRLAYRFSDNIDEAQDLTQEIFMRVFERLGGFRRESMFSTWLYRVATNICLNQRRKPQATESLEALKNQIVDAASNPAAAYAHRELSEQMQAAISELPESLKSVFILVGLEDLSYQQAADVLGLTVEAVRMRMSRARRELKEKLSLYLES
jgi:RNA polymerase sigma-70 factor (ECF subfamily)